MATHKSASGAAKQKRASDIKRAAFMAKHGVKRTTYRDPITNVMRAVGTYPGVNGGKIKG